MEFTDRLMAVDRAVAQYLRFAHSNTLPSEVIPELWADLLHWHERFVTREPMSRRQVRKFVNEAVKTFYEERDALAKGDDPLRRPRYGLVEQMAEYTLSVPQPRRVVPMEATMPAPPLRGPNDCDHCGRTAELFYNEATGSSLCEGCDRYFTEEENDVPADSTRIDRRDDHPF